MPDKTFEVTPTQITAQPVGMTVFIQLLNHGEIEYRMAILEPEQSRRLYGMLKHQIHGGRLKVTQECFDLDRVGIDTPRIIVPGGLPSA